MTGHVPSHSVDVAAYQPGRWWDWPIFTGPHDARPGPMVGDRGEAAATIGGNFGGNCKTPRKESFSYQHVSSCM